MVEQQKEEADWQPIENNEFVIYPQTRATQQPELQVENVAMAIVNGGITSYIVLLDFKS